MSSMEIFNGFLHVNFYENYPSHDKAMAAVHTLRTLVETATGVCESLIRNALSIEEVRDFETGPEWQVRMRGSFRLREEVPAGAELTPPQKNGFSLLPNGCALYWSQSEFGRVYHSDEVGGGVFVWDPSVVDPHTLLAAIVQEETFRRLESEIARRKEKDKASQERAFGTLPDDYEAPHG